MVMVFGISTKKLAKDFLLVQEVLEQEVQEVQGLQGVQGPWEPDLHFICRNIVFMFYILFLFYLFYSIGSKAVYS